MCLFTWEQMSILLRNQVQESENLSLESLWNASNMMAKDKSLSYADRENCFLGKMDGYVMKKTGMAKDDYYQLLYHNYTKSSIARCKNEVKYWKREKETVQGYTKEQAVAELIEAKKINEKINTIVTYERKLKSMML